MVASVKRMTMVAFLVFLITVQSFTVSAINNYDIEYEGVLGSYYNTDDSEGEKSSDASRISVTGDISYSKSENLYYVYTENISMPFTSTVMDTMITQDAVSITAPKGVSCTLYCNGEEYAGDLSNITAPGSYALNIKTNSGAQKIILSFIIVSDYISSVSSYDIPLGFNIESLTVDGEVIAVSSGTVSFEKEGKYELVYVCPATDVEYSLNVYVDHTAPTLKLEAVKDGKAWGPVDVSDLEPDAVLYVYRDGEREEISDSLITRSGKYELIAEDYAGNKTDYSFTVMIYFNAASIVLFVLLFLLILLITVYILYSRKKPRVR